MAEAPKNAWATLVTQDNYLVGALVMNASLKKHNSAYPLVVYATSDLSANAREAMTNQGILIRDVSFVEHPERVKLMPSFERFAATWSKLAAFQLTEFERVVMVDSDMVVRANMDELMTMDLPEGWIAAAHACTCNPNAIKTYPASWIPENCAHTSAQYGVEPLAPENFTKVTHHSLNSGLVVLHPSEKVFDELKSILETDIVTTFQFPDQDLLAYHFKDRFLPISYRYNALKTLRQCHPHIWRDDEVKNVHYILHVKPWHKALPETDVHYVAHSWWWEEYDELVENWGDAPYLDLVKKCLGKKE